VPLSERERHGTELNGAGDHEAGQHKPEKEPAPEPEYRGSIPLGATASSGELKEGPHRGSGVHDDEDAAHATVAAAAGAGEGVERLEAGAYTRPLFSSR
jgi:hypothetical protein